MKMIKHLILAVVLLAGIILPTKADLATYPLSTTSTPIVILTNISGKIGSITMANASAAAITLKFYDGIYTSLTRTNAAYTNNVAAVASVVTTYTNTLGITESRTNSTMTYTPTPVASAAISLTPFVQVTVPASSTYVFTPLNTLTFGQGIVVGTSATNIAATVDYTPSR